MIRIMKLSIFTAILIVFLSSSLWSQQTLSLEDALKIAAENNPEIRQAKLNLERSQHYYDASKAALKTQVNLRLTPLTYSKDKMYVTSGIGSSGWQTYKTITSSGYLSIYQPIKWTDGTLRLTSGINWQKAEQESPWYQNYSSESFGNNLYLSYYQPIFTYNRIRLELKELELQLENASLYYGIQKLWLEKMVTQEFCYIYYDRIVLEVMKEALDFLEQSYEVIKQRADTVIVAEEELFQTEVSLAIKQSGLRNNQIVYNNALDRFKVLIGIPIAEELDIIADINKKDVIVDREKAIDHGTKHRLELRQREIYIEESLFQLIRSSALNEFRGSIDLSYRLADSDEQFIDTFDKPSQDQRISLSLEIPLFDWGRRKSYIKAAETTVESNKIRAEDERNEIIIGIRQAYRQFENQIAQIEITSKSSKKAEATFKKFFEHYKTGNLPGVMLKIYLDQYSYQKLAYTMALIQYRLALLDLKIQSLWDFERNQQLFPLEQL